MKTAKVWVAIALGLALSSTILLESTVASAAPASAGLTLVVNSTADLSDATPGDGVCETVALTTVCTLRAGIEEANALPGLDTIEFRIGSGHQVITPTQSLPEVADQLIIDGATQPGSNLGSPMIELDGSFASRESGATDGLVIIAGGSIVRGLVINSFDGAGIRLSSEGGNRVEGSFIGTNSTGVSAEANGAGILIQDSADNIIGGAAPSTRNVVSGNSGVGSFSFAGSGVLITGGNSTGNIIRGNYIGTDVTGTKPIGNRLGIITNPGSFGLKSPANNLIGGAEPGAGNLISGNSARGVSICCEETGATILGNLIGTDITGTKPVGNGTGIVIFGSQAKVRIGGDLPGERNLISANTESGIELSSSQSLVQGNFIGTDITGTKALGNRYGILTYRGSDDLIGGADGAGNVISGNEVFGILIFSSATRNSVSGNYIGTDVSGTAPLGNGRSGVAIQEASGNIIGGHSGMGNLISANGGGDGLDDPFGIFGVGSGVAIFGASAKANEVFGNSIGVGLDGTPMGNTRHGVLISGGASSNVVGGAGDLANTIAYNGKVGVAIPDHPFAEDGIRNHVRRNSIFGNGELGIDIAANGVTPNDPGDSDAVANRGQNFPVLTGITVGGATTIHGVLNSTPNKSFVLEFFSNDGCDPSGFGEGFNFLGSKLVTTNAQGDVKFKITLPPPPAGGNSITATATDTEGNTSEFSNCRSSAPR